MRKVPNLRKATENPSDGAGEIPNDKHDETNLPQFPS